METLFILPCRSRPRLSQPGHRSAPLPLSPSTAVAGAGVSITPSLRRLELIRNSQQDPHGLSQRLHRQAGPQAHPRASPGILKGISAWNLPCPAHMLQPKATHRCLSLGRAIRLPCTQQTQERAQSSTFAEVLEKSQASPQRRRPLLPSISVPAQMMQS